jgi:DNA-binding IclR family transcriptional regulator
VRRGKLCHMDRSEVSRHEVDVYRTLMAAGSTWLSSKEIANRAAVAPRTARAHALKLVRLGVAEQAEVFPGHRYRISEFADQRSRGYADRLRRAADVLGVTLTKGSPS